MNRFVDLLWLGSFKLKGFKGDSRSGLLKKSDRPPDYGQSVNVHTQMIRGIQEIEVQGIQYIRMNSNGLNGFTSFFLLSSTINITKLVNF